MMPTDLLSGETSTIGRNGREIISLGKGGLMRITTLKLLPL